MSRFAGLPKYSSFGQPGTSSQPHQPHHPHLRCEDDDGGGEGYQQGAHAQDSTVSSGSTYTSSDGGGGGGARRRFGVGEVKGDNDHNHTSSEAGQDSGILGPEAYAAMRRSRFSRRRALSTLYKEMLELKNFAGLNYTAVSIRTSTL